MLYQDKHDKVNHVKKACECGVELTGASALCFLDFTSVFCARSGIVEMMNHKANSCLLRKVFCKYCSRSFTAGQLIGVSLTAPSAPAVALTALLLLRRQITK